MQEEEKSPQEGAGLIAKEVVRAVLEFFRSDEGKRLIKELMTEHQTIKISIPDLPLRRSRQALS
jgi:hypothetical protein